MSSYLGDIVQYIRGVSAISFRNNIYMGNDINAIDTAYSDTQNHKLSVFFVPAETTVGSGEEGKLIQTKYFNAYIFVPVEEDVAATDGWEQAINAGNTMNSYLVNTTVGVNKLKYISGREFRVGRGYYIYVMAYSIDTLVSGSIGSQTVSYFKYTGETDGSATYTKSVLSNCSTDENYAISRMVLGTYRQYGCEVIVSGSTTINPTHKDWFVIGTYTGSYNKAAAIAAGKRVYEVNQWKIFYGDANGTRIGTRIVGA